MAFQQFMRLRVQFDLDPERTRHTGRCNIIMGRTYAARGKDIVELCPAFIDRLDDRGFDIGNHPRFCQANAKLVQLLRQIRQILVMGPSRQDFIADNDQTGPNRFRHHNLANLNSIFKYDRQKGSDRHRKSRNIATSGTSAGGIG